jgi:endonuclease-8
VTARGKHLFIEFDSGTALRIHLGMYGSWHRYSRGEAWRKPRSQASVALATAEAEYVCFNAREVEIVTLPSVREKVLRSRIGPDLIADDVDFETLAARAREYLDGDVLLADVLLDQRVASGIGNVYKSEVLFIERLMPNLVLREVSNRDLERCYRTAADRLRRNLGGGRRTTRLQRDAAGRLWVYGRSGLPYLRCDGRIESRRMGRHHRGTYWCGSCQEPNPDISPGGREYC